MQVYRPRSFPLWGLHGISRMPRWGRYVEPLFTNPDWKCVEE